MFVLHSQRGCDVISQRRVLPPDGASVVDAGLTGESQLRSGEAGTAMFENVDRYIFAHKHTPVLCEEFSGQNVLSST